MGIAEYSNKSSLFVNAEKGDFTLKPDAPFYDDIGFRPIQAKEIGLYNNEYRATPIDK